MPKKRKTTKSKKRKRRSKTRNNRPFWIILFAGVLMVWGGIANGPGIVGAIGQLAINSDTIDNPMLVFLICLVIWVAAIFGALGGFSVMLGAFVIRGDHVRIGKIVVGLGAGMGLFTLIIMLILVVLGGINAVLAVLWLLSHSLGAIGIVLSIYGRAKVQ